MSYADLKFKTPVHADKADTADEVEQSGHSGCPPRSAWNAVAERSGATAVALTAKKNL